MKRHLEGAFIFAIVSWALAIGAGLAVLIGVGLAEAF